MIFCSSAASAGEAGAEESVVGSWGAVDPYMGGT